MVTYVHIKNKILIFTKMSLHAYWISIRCNRFWNVSLIRLHTHIQTLHGFPPRLRLHGLTERDALGSFKTEPRPLSLFCQKYVLVTITANTELQNSFNEDWTDSSRGIFALSFPDEKAVEKNNMDGHCTHWDTCRLTDYNKH